MKKHLRHVLLWIYDKNNQIKGDDAVEEIREVYGHESIGRMTVFRWLKKFRNGDKNVDDLEDDPRSGRPSKFNEKFSSSCLRLVFSLERDGARYIVEKYIPSTLAMMFAWVAPYVPYNYEDVRIITPITVLLTLVQMEKGDMVVRTSYLTSMDRWFAAMKAFSVLSLIESLVVLALIKRSRGMEKQALRAITEYEKDFYQSEGKRLTGLYHRVDSAARFLSPVFFILYFVYYVLYVAQGDERHCITESIFKQENGTS